LKDIHLPVEVNQFPNAPGWWILILLLLSALAFYLYKKYQFKKAIRLLSPAKKEIEILRTVSHDDLNPHAVASLSGLLKRISLIYFGKPNIASLNGFEWLSFLNQQSKSLSINADSSTALVEFSKQDGYLLTQAAYQKSPQIDYAQWQQLLTTSELWIETVIVSFAKKRLHKKPKEYAPKIASSEKTLATGEPS
jgi:hypothetical protein